jgi:NADH:ubiquinone reductase (H+-translocating)
VGTVSTLASRAHHVVVVGGGFGGLQAVSKLRRAPVEVTLVDRRNFHLFQPLTYQVATGRLRLARSPIRSASFSFATHWRGARLITGPSTAGEQRDG